MLHASLCTETLSVSYKNFMNKLLLNQLSFIRKKYLRPSLCLFELQNSFLSLDAVSETITNCVTVRTDKWHTWYWNQKCRSFVNPSWKDKQATSRSGMFIDMSVLIFNLSFNLIRRRGFFFRSSVKNDFFFCHERAWNFLSIIMYFKTWDFRHWWS